MVKDLKIDRITKVSDEFMDLLRDAGYLELGACIQCGNCTASCPSGRRTALRTREIMRKAVLGQEEMLKNKELWLCTTCYTCYERCPRNIPITDIIIFLRNIAVERGNILEPHWNVCNILFNTGHIVPIDNEKHNILRESYGINRLPPTVHAYPESLKELQNLIESTGFDKKVKIGKYDQKKE